MSVNVLLVCRLRPIAEVSFFHLRDNSVGTGGKGVSVWINVRYSKIEEEVGEKGPNALCQKYLET